MITHAPLTCIEELGAGSAKKTTHLLRAQIERRGTGIFAPIDVSLPGLRACRDVVWQNLPKLEVHGLHARYEDGLSSIDQNLPTLFVFLGSTIGNFNPSDFVRLVSLLSPAMRPHDYFLRGADRLRALEV